MTLPFAKRHREDAYYLALLGLLSVFFYLPYWSFRTVMYQKDLQELVVPVLHWLHGRYSAGLPEAWMQGIMGGVPTTDAASSAAYYPPMRLILTLYPALQALILILWSHTWWAACGCYALVRQQKGSPGAAFVAAVLGAFGGGLVFAQAWLTVGISLAWTPWTLLGLFLIQAGDRRRRLAGTGLLALALGLGFDGGYPGMSVYLTGVLALLHLAWLAGRPGWDQALKVWRSLGLAAIAAALMVLGPVWATQRLAPQSIRGQALNVAEAGLGSMSPASLFQTFLPEALGRTWDNSYLGMSWRWGSHQCQGLVLYLGVLGTILALFAFAKAPRRHAVWGLACGVLVLYALGVNTPLFPYFIRLPLLDHLRGTVKAAELVVFMLLIPVAWGVDHLEQGRPRFWVGGLGLLALGLLGSALLLTLGQDRLMAAGQRHIQAKVLGDAIHHYPAQYYTDRLSLWLEVLRGHLLKQGAWALAAAVGLGLVRWRAWPAGLLLGLLLFGELASNGMHVTPRMDSQVYERVPDSVAAVLQLEGPQHEPYRALVWAWSDYLRASFPQGRKEGDLEAERAFLELPQRDMPLVYGLDLYNAYFVSRLRRQEPLHGWFMDIFAETDMVAHTRELLRRRRLWDLGAAKYVFSARPLDAPGLQLLRQGPPLLYRNLQALPLAYFADLASGGWTQDSAEAALCDPASPEAKAARPALVEASATLGRAPGSVQWRHDDDAWWQLEVDCGAGGGTLVLSRTYYQGLFEASIDGRPVELWAANAGFCALAVPAGKHTVSVVLKDPQAGPSWAAWWLGLLLALGCLLAGLGYRRSEPAR